MARTIGNQGHGGITAAFVSAPGRSRATPSAFLGAPCRRGSPPALLAFAVLVAQYYFPLRTFRRRLTASESRQSESRNHAIGQSRPDHHSAGARNQQRAVNAQTSNAADRTRVGCTLANRALPACWCRTSAITRHATIPFPAPPFGVIATIIPQRCHPAAAITATSQLQQDRESRYAATSCFTAGRQRHDHTADAPQTILYQRLNHRATDSAKYSCPRHLAIIGKSAAFCCQFLPLGAKLTVSLYALLCKALMDLLGKLGDSKSADIRFTVCPVWPLRYLSRQM